MAANLCWTLLILKYVQVGEGLVLAAGGCGHAAKGADEIGETF